MSNVNLPILYSFRRCPYAMRARMAIVYCGVNVELREVDLKNKPDELIKISPKATVPVLIATNGLLFDESLDIIKWAMLIRDDDGWSDYNIEQNELASNLIEENDNEFKSNLDKYKYSKRFSEYSETHYRQQGETYLSKLNTILMNTPFLIKDKLTYVDIAIAPFIRQFANVDIDWFRGSQYQQLVNWLDEILKSTIFMNTMQKYPVWNSDNEKNIFP